MREERERLVAVYNNPASINTICAHVADGGSLIDLCKQWNVKYGDVISWVHAHPENEKLYRKACLARGEFVIEKLLHELRTIASFDIRTLYDEEGALLPPSQWPDDVSKAVAGVDTFEVMQDGLKLGENKKVKMLDKLKAIELAGKNLALFTDKHEHKVVHTLEDMVAGSLKKVEE